MMSIEMRAVAFDAQTKPKSLLQACGDREIFGQVWVEPGTLQLGTKQHHGIPWIVWVLLKNVVSTGRDYFWSQSYLSILSWILWGIRTWAVVM